MLIGLNLTSCQIEIRWREKNKTMRGPIKVGDTGEFGKYCENDNFATIANRAKHKAMRGPIKVGDTGKLGKYSENDNFATIANRAKHKAMRGPIKVGDTGEFGKYGENDNFAKFANKAWKFTNQHEEQGAEERIWENGGYGSSK